MEVVNENCIGDLKLKSHSTSEETNSDSIKLNGDVNGDEDMEVGEESPCNGDSSAAVESMDVSENGVEEANSTDPVEDQSGKNDELENDVQDQAEEEVSQDQPVEESITDGDNESEKLVEKEEDNDVEQGEENQEDSNNEAPKVAVAESAESIEAEDGEEDDIEGEDEEPIDEDKENELLEGGVEEEDGPEPAVTLQRITKDSRGLDKSESKDEKWDDNEEKDSDSVTIDLVTPVKDDECEDDARTESTPEKTPGGSAKKKKSLPITNVTPRRSSRNLNKTKSYLEETEDKSEDDVDEVKEVTAVKTPIKTIPLIQEIKPAVVIQPATTIKKNTIVVNDTKRLAEIAAGSKAAAAKGGKKEPTLVIIDTNSLLANKGGQVSLTPTISSRVSVVPVTAGTQSIFSAKSMKLPAAVSITPPQPKAQVTPLSLTSKQVKIPAAVSITPPQPKPQVILPSLTDDMFVVEAPSFIVPYVYEKPPVNDLREFNKVLEKKVKEEAIEKRKKEEEEDRKREEEERKMKEIASGGDIKEEDVTVKEEVMDVDKTEKVKEEDEEEKMEVDETGVKTEDAEVKTETDKDISSDKESKDKETEEEPKDKETDEPSQDKVKEEVGDKELKVDDKESKVDDKESKVDDKESKVDDKESKVGDKESKVDDKESKDKLADKDSKDKDASKEKVEEVKTEDKEKPEEKKAAPPATASPSTTAPVEKKPEGEVLEDKTNKTKSDNYFENPLGKFFMQIGINLVQEHVQADLLKNQIKKKDKEGSKCSADVHMAISALTKTLEVSKENNKPFTYELKKCQLCNFKTESQLVMAHHLETPHMKNFVYRCNFCDLEVRSPHDILFHMEAEHNVRGRLDRSPAFHQCPNCPFEDNQKGKLSRHLLSCAKKYRPERNQEPPLEWEPPAKIPRVRGARGLPLYPASAAASLTNAARLASPVPGVSTPLSRLAASQAALAAQRGRGRPPIYVQRYPTSSPSSAQKLAAHIRQGGVVFRPSNQPPVLLPTAPYSLTPSLIQQAKVSNGATAKILQQPSISITPLPRAGSAAASPTAPAAAAAAAASAQPKPGRPPTAATPAKNSFVICEICDGYIKDLEQLRNHMQWIHKVKIHPKMIYNRPPLNCQKCQFRFFTDQGLERHLLGSHGLVTSSMQEAANKGKDGGRCPVCGRVYQWKLLNHVARDHSMSLKPAHLSYKCTVCTATFGMYKQFENHVYSAHSVVAKRVIDKSKPGAVSSSPGAPSVPSHQPSTSNSQPSESRLQPLKINDEITIIPQPARAKQPATKTAGGATVTPTSAKQPPK